MLQTKSNRCIIGLNDFTTFKIGVRTLKFSILLLIGISAIRLEAMTVTFINPGHATPNETGKFWYNVDLFMQKAADDLGIRLRILHAERNHIKMKALVDNALKERPDYLILVNEQGQGQAMLDKLANSKIPVFFLLNGLSDEQKRPPYLGSLQPDNVRGGYKLMRGLIEKSEDMGNATANILALQGDHQTPAARDRRIGMLAAIEQAGKRARLLEDTVAFWSETKGFEKVYGLSHRYPEMNVIWCANDPIAFGAARAMKKRQKRDSVHIGGINWDIDPNGLKSDVSFGGHVVLGGFALVMLWDHHKEALAKDKMERVLDIFESDASPQGQLLKEIQTTETMEKVDFRRFSCTDGACSPYSVANLLK